MVGGGSRSALWTRLLATALDHAIDLPPGANVSGPAGAARLAAVATGVSIDTLSAKTDAAKTIGPDRAIAGILAEQFARFSNLLPAQG
jgi:xylulokinase